jgi:hypothetical protein
MNLAESHPDFDKALELLMLLAQPSRKWSEATTAQLLARDLGIPGETDRERQRGISKLVQRLRSNTAWRLNIESWADPKRKWNRHYALRYDTIRKANKLAQGYWEKVYETNGRLLSPPGGSCRRRKVATRPIFSGNRPAVRRRAARTTAPVKFGYSLGRGGFVLGADAPVCARLSIARPVALPATGRAFDSASHRAGF